MKPKTIRITYSILTALFCLASTADAFGGLTKQKAGVDGMNHLGYPLYVMTMLGVAKLLGVIAILQTKFITIKEWAFAGFTFTFLGVFWSRAYVGDGLGLLIPPVVTLAIMLVYYYFWKKMLALNSAK